MLTLILYLFIDFFVNLPFGYWRANVRKFSVQWFLAVHLPVFLVGYLRHSLDYGWIGITIPLFIIAYFSGQLFGARMSIAMRKYGKVSSSLFHDIARRSWIILIGRS